MEQLYKRKNLPVEVFEVNILAASDENLLRISRELGLSLNLQEMKACKRYFQKIRRNPTDIELQTIGQTWSEHCFHKTFKGTVIFKGKKFRLFKDFIRKATEELAPEWCISVFEDNAGIVDFENGYGIAVKVETHNHPSAVEPFGGAATGIGGVIRDILGVWAEPIANIDVLGFGPLDVSYSILPPGMKHPKYIFSGVVAGIGCYGNNMGIPTVAGAVYFDESYIGNPVVYCGCVGLLPLDKCVKNTRPGDFAVLAGGRTGRDGIHGVTFASEELRGDLEALRSAVQIPDPIEEEKLRRAILRIRDEKLASAITDLGGGGLSCAASEMANRANCGVEIWLEKVPLKHAGMAPWEIWISESQERMLLSVPKKNLRRVLQIFEEEEVEATPVGVFNNKKSVEVFWKKIRILDLKLDFLFSPPLPVRVARISTCGEPEPKISDGKEETLLLRLLSSPNICSREDIIRTYDHEVQGRSVLKPLQGKHSGPNDAAVLRPLPDSWKGVVISCGLKPRYGKIDPYWMAASSIEEAIRNNIAVGGERQAILDNFTWGNPEKPEQLGALLSACKACYDFAKVFGVPFISGKDSLYNESELDPVTPTLLITAVGIIRDIKKAVSLDLKEVGDPLYILGRTYNELGGSELLAIFGKLGSNVPRVRPKESKKVMKSVQRAIDSECVKACHDLSEGGLAVALAEMVISSDFGASVDLSEVPTQTKLSNTSLLFSESNGRFLVEVAKEREKEFESLVKGDFAKIGVVCKKRSLEIRRDGKTIICLSSEKLRSAWKKRLW
ncbi:MAG: phosphoribosylformylglycinamidine synthase subunit PurL [Candidatus Hadarchaeales archaeon]